MNGYRRNHATSLAIKYFEKVATSAYGKLCYITVGPESKPKPKDYCYCESCGAYVGMSEYAPWVLKVKAGRPRKLIYQLVLDGIAVSNLVETVVEALKRDLPRDLPIDPAAGVSG